MEPVRNEAQVEPMVVAPRGPRPGRRLLYALIGAAVLVGVFFLVRSTQAPAGGKGAPAPQARAVPVTAAAATRRDVPVYLDGLGNVVAFKTVTVKTQVDGRLDQVLFKEGQMVRAGQVLAQIDPRPFQSQLHQAEGAKARDGAQLASGRLDLDRYRQLAKEKLIPQQQVDDQAGSVGQLEGAVAVDEAAIETAKLNIEWARITSPIDGVTGIRIVDPGNVVHAADQGGIVIVTQLDPIAIIFTLPQDQLTAVVEAMGRESLVVDAFARDGTTLLGTGRLELIDNQINQATSTIRLKAIFPNPRRLLWPNQFVNARLHLSQRKGALVVPATAIQRGPNGVYVYVVGADSTVAPRTLEVAASSGDLAVIASGIEEGERVVVDGQNQLRAGSKVAVREAGKDAGKGAPAASAGASGGSAAAPPAVGGKTTAR